MVSKATDEEQKNIFPLVYFDEMTKGVFGKMRNRQVSLSCLRGSNFTNRNQNNCNFVIWLLPGSLHFICKIIPNLAQTSHPLRTLGANQ